MSQETGMDRGMKTSMNAMEKKPIWSSETP
jgi:hypothetical protein